VSESEPFARAITAIDTANAEDPRRVRVRDRDGPQEVVHAVLVTEWVRELAPDASEALLLAARGHHLRRWTVPRSSYPTGRAGYLRWRRDLHEQHARELGEILTSAGYDDATIARVQAIVRKQGLGRGDDEVQVLEDALCLVFLEAQLADVAARLDPAKLTGVLQKTARKMSDRGRAAIARVPLGPAERELLAHAVGPAVPVHRYLAALSSGAWDELRACLAENVERRGPYGDDFHDRDEYADFLRDTISALSGYELRVERVLVADGTVTVELNETVDTNDGRLRTDEAVVFDVAGDLITRVAVYLQSSRVV
jgi:ketosteroid isomerase-like protein